MNSIIFSRACFVVAFVLLLVQEIVVCFHHCLFSESITPGHSFSFFIFFKLQEYMYFLLFYLFYLTYFYATFPLSQGPHIKGDIHTIELEMNPNWLSRYISKQC